MAPLPTRQAAHGAQAPGNRPHAEDHHRPGSRFRHAARDETRDIAEETRPIGHSGLASTLFRSGEIGEARQRPIIVEPQGLAAIQAVTPGIVDPHPVGIRLERRFDELAWYLQNRRIVVAARRERLVPDARAQAGLDRRRNRCRAPALAIERKKASLVAREDRDQQTDDQQQQQHRILFAALRAHPVSRRPGDRFHPVPHPPSEESVAP